MVNVLNGNLLDVHNKKKCCLGKIEKIGFLFKQRFLILPVCQIIQAHIQAAVVRENIKDHVLDPDQDPVQDHLHTHHQDQRNIKNLIQTEKMILNKNTVSIFN